MNREQFLKTLEASLAAFTEEERKDILYDYEEHIRIGLESGKTEDELIEELGSPEDIARQYKGGSDTEREQNLYDEIRASISNNTAFAEEPPTTPIYIEKKPERNIGSSILATLALGFFNIVFVIWIFVAFGAALFGFAVAAIAIAFSGLVATFAPIITPIFPVAVSMPSNMPYAIILLLGIGTTALGALFCIGVFYLIKYFCIITYKYIKWNISIIKGR